MKLSTHVSLPLTYPDFIIRRSCLRSPWCGKHGSWSMWWLAILPPSKKSEKDRCWCLAHSPVLFNPPNGAAHSGWVYPLLWNLSGKVCIEYLKVCFLTDSKANCSEDQEEPWLFTKGALQLTNLLWEYTSPEYTPTWCQSSRPHKRKRCLSFMWQVPVKSTAIWKLKLTASAQHWKDHFCITVKKQKRWLVHRWTSPIGNLDKFTGSKQASSRDFLDWGKWGEKTHLKGRWHSSLGWAPQQNKKENKLSTSLHLWLLPDCSYNMTSHLILPLPSLPWWFVHPHCEPMLTLCSLNCFLSATEGASREWLYKKILMLVIAIIKVMVVRLGMG